MSIREQIKANMILIRGREEVLFEVSEFSNSICDALFEVRTYLETNKKDKVPMGYDMLKSLFGSIDGKLAEEVLRDALRNTARRRLDEALENRKKELGEGSGKLDK